jgi:nitrate reductase gamma subunit
MDLVAITRGIAILGSAIGVLGLLVRLDEIMKRPFKQDLARQRGDVRRGVLYAFTLGMAPWEKESTRRHWIAYLRGIVFHVGTFTAFGVLFVSPWLDRFPPLLIDLAAILCGLGGVAGFAGIPMRLSGENERVLSLPDDYLSIFLVSLFTALACVALLVRAWLPAFYLATAVMSVYIPFSKIRHCVYFFYSKFFFGAGFGYRGVIGQAPGKYNE